MTDEATRRKWDRAASKYDWLNSFGAERRWAPVKRNLFSSMQGKILFVAVGTGLDIAHFPAGRDIVGIDISPRMLEQAFARARDYEGNLTLREMDVHALEFDDATFDQVFTSCTFCSVPNPVNGLRSLRRVLKPGAELHMFEHTGSDIFPFNWMLDLMTPFSRRVGPELNRPTVANVASAGFELRRVEHVFLDVVKMIHAVSPGPGP